MDDAIIFDGQIQAIKTLVDGGLRVTFDLPEGAINAVVELMRLKFEGVPLRVAVARSETKDGADE